MEEYGWHPAFSLASTEFETQESNIHSLKSMPKTVQSEKLSLGLIARHK